MVLDPKNVRCADITLSSVAVEEPTTLMLAFEPLASATVSNEHRSQTSKDLGMRPKIA